MNVTLATLSLIALHPFSLVNKGELFEQNENYISNRKPNFKIRRVVRIYSVGISYSIIVKFHFP